MCIVCKAFSSVYSYLSLLFFLGYYETFIVRAVLLKPLEPVTYTYTLCHPTISLYFANFISEDIAAKIVMLILMTVVSSSNMTFYLIQRIHNIC